MQNYYNSIVWNTSSFKTMKHTYLFRAETIVLRMKIKLKHARK